ncbi:MAG: 23S rRNA (adenine(2503)-C(2))-methyltransferase RlmN [Patescibacteria group bacterium]
MNLEKLYTIMEDQPKYRLTQVKDAVFRLLIADWDEATNIPKETRKRLRAECPLEINGEIFASKDSKTTKALITLEDGLQIETVLLIHKDGRHTVCVSTQVGCPMGCAFCATGKLGLERNLTAGEILDQVLFFSRLLKDKDERVSNIVFMGMGEPFLNYDNVLSAINYLNKDLGIGARRISVSTCGVIYGINKLADLDLQINLAISLHAPNQKLRDQLMPVSNHTPLNKLFEAVDNYIAKTGRRVMFEYLMIKNANDSVELAEQLAELMNKPLYMVNLIAYNPTDVFKPSDPRTIAEFKEVLERAGVTVTQRYSFGQDINAACGQLANKKL